MTLRVPEAHLAVWVVFKVTLEESGESLLTGVVGLIAITVGIAIGLLLLIVAMDQPWLRFCLVGGMAALALFLSMTFVIGTAGFVLGLISSIVLTGPDFLPSPEYAIRLTLWMWSVFALGIACAVAANLLIAPTDPAVLLRQELGRRAGAAQAAIARRLGQPAAGSEVARLAVAGVARGIALLRSAELLHPSPRGRPAQQRAEIPLVHRLVTPAAALEVLSRDPPAVERARLEAVGAACARVRSALEDDRTLTPVQARVAAALPEHGSASLPVLVELEQIVALLEQALGPEGSALAAGAPEPERRSPFVKDAFPNPEYVQYALKGALAVSLCYLLQSSVDWPGIRTCLITCMIVGLTSEGATVQKGTLRIAGALVGGALGFLAILALIPNMESIASLALLVAAGSAVAGWVYLGSARISYAGVQIALAFYICVLQGFGPSWYFYTIRDRLVGILLGNLIITLVFQYVWPVRAGAAMWTSLGSALRAMAELARVTSRGDEPAVTREIHGLRLEASRHFAAAQQSAEEAAFEWGSSGRAAAARDRLQAAAAEAQAVFLTQLAVASQRQDAASAELPEALVAGARGFDATVAEALDVLADCARSAESRELPDLRGSLAALAGLAGVQSARIASPEAAAQMEARLALYRELVPHLEQLGSQGFVG